MRSELSEFAASCIPNAATCNEALTQASANTYDGTTPFLIFDTDTHRIVACHEEVTWISRTGAPLPDRTDGPAVIRADGSCEWWVRGHRIDEPGVYKRVATDPVLADRLDQLRAAIQEYEPHRLRWEEAGLARACVQVDMENGCWDTFVSTLVRAIACGKGTWRPTPDIQETQSTERHFEWRKRLIKEDAIADAIAAACTS